MFILNKVLVKNIKTTFGSKGDDWLNDLEIVIIKCIEIWNLSNIKILDNQTYNFVMIAKSVELGDVLVKIGFNDGTYNQELNATGLLNSPIIREIYNYNQEFNALLMKLINPGKTLHNISDSDKQLEIGCRLIKSISKECDSSIKMDSYKVWLDKAFNYIRLNSLGGSSFNRYIKIAEDFYNQLELDYDCNYLVHGDFHHDNILQSENEWIVIDPKGLIAFWFTDCGRFLINHIWKIPINRRYEHVPEIIKKVSSLLHIPERVIFQSIFIETVLCYAWSFQGYLTDTEKNSLGIEMNEEIEVYTALFNLFL